MFTNPPKHYFETSYHRFDCSYYNENYLFDFIIIDLCYGVLFVLFNFIYCYLLYYILLDPNPFILVHGIILQLILLNLNLFFDI